MTGPLWNTGTAIINCHHCAFCCKQSGAKTTGENEKGTDLKPERAVPIRDKKPVLGGSSRPVWGKQFPTLILSLTSGAGERLGKLSVPTSSFNKKRTEAWSDGVRWG